MLGSCEASKEIMQPDPKDDYPNFEQKLERRDNRLDSLRSKNAPDES